MKLPTTALLLTTTTLTSALALPQLQLNLHRSTTATSASPTRPIPQLPMHTTALMAGAAWTPAANPSPTSGTPQAPTSAPTSSTKPGKEWRDL
ncbi:hypothetical protein BU16DRAFT_530187 [Lophium mytilinum]|uniref:Uncharacterized protein n=1 Tax=Lophium mytilinum TaxID=390894 RepID=A0A6A6QH55_9PEZI|nr:hypothetical protein BU16DRAFT_530187 [Lophium mytilinum]